MEVEIFRRAKRSGYWKRNAGTVVTLWGGRREASKGQKGVLFLVGGGTYFMRGREKTLRI